MLDISGLFDESYYLRQNPDVGAGVASGTIANGLDRFMTIGQYQGQNPSAWFDTEYYLQSNPDVAAVVATGSTTAIQHFINAGQFEGRNPIAEFSTASYLSENPDVAAAVEADLLTGYEHFIESGQFEGRDPSHSFDTDYYLTQNPDVAAVVGAGELSAIEHYLESGKAEGRLTVATNSAIALSPTNDRNTENGSTTDLGILSSSVNLTGFVGNTTPERIYRFSVNTPSTIDLQLTGLSADADALLYQDFNDNDRIDAGEVLQISQHTGTTSEAIATALSQGNYFIAIAQYQGETDYNLSLSASAIANVPPDAAGNTLLQARDLGLLQGEIRLNDFVGNADIRDVYRFSVTETTRIAIDLNGLSADTDLFLVQDINQDGLIVEPIEVLGESANPGVTSEGVSISALAPGTYYISVKSFEGDTNYTLNLSGSAIATATANPPTPLPNFDPNYGFGAVDASAAVARAIGEPTPFVDVSNPIVNNYGIDAVKAPEVWNRGYTGEGTIVAVLDTGIDLSHRDLQGNLWVNADEIPGDRIDNDGNGYIDDISGYDFADFDADPSSKSSDESHGTHIAGIIAAQNNGIDGSSFFGTPYDVTGVAYGATIMPVRVLNNRQSFDQFEISVAAGIRYAVDNGARVLNLSLGNFPDEPPTDRIAAALRYARDRGVVAVIASGNEKDAGAILPADPAIRAAQDLGIAVGAIDRDRRVADFSNPASSLLGIYDFVVAPGVEIRSTIPGGYAVFDGTSMAAPFVSGIAALMLQANPYLTPAEVETILSETANPVGITV